MLAKIVISYKNFRNALAYRKAVRETINELSALTNGELADIGISRGEIRHIANTCLPKPVMEEVEPVEANDNIKGWV
tara:strand:+ start:2522 stop:2752 length:231 start_codon:yes stop_codon:yes gene_type:complete